MKRPKTKILSPLEMLISTRRELAPPTRRFKDKSKYNRKPKHKESR